MTAKFGSGFSYSRKIGFICLSMLILLAVTNCEKPQRLLKISTLSPVDSLISYAGATLQVEITDLGIDPISEFGIEISKSSLFLQPEALKVNSAASKRVFGVKFQNLDPGIQYYYRSYAKLKSSTELIYALDDKSFTTKATRKATVTISDPSDKTLNTIKISGSVTDEGGEAVTRKGLCWGSSPSPDIASCIDTTINGSGPGAFTGKMDGLNPGAEYHVRAYAINAKGVGYSDDKQVTTFQLSDAVTTAATAITTGSAILNGTVNANNSSSVVTFDYGTTISYGQSVTATQSPVTGNTATSVSANITGLTPGTTYHYKIKSVSAAGTSTGMDDTFTTLFPPPVVISAAATYVTSTGATLNGTVNANNTSTTVTFEYGTTTGYDYSATASQSPVTGTTVANVSAVITGLDPSTTYHFRVKATSEGGTTNGSDLTFTTEAPPPTVTDYDGNVYNTVQIGTQDWMQENLKTTSYNNGDPIPNVTDNLTWAGLYSEAYCWYNNNEAAYKNIYGALYTIYAAGDVRNICPTGWHTASDEDWTILTDFLSGSTVAGGKLKETGTTHWTDPNTGATNSSGLTIMPGGNRSTAWGTFSGLNTWAGIWVSQSESSTIAGFRNMNYTSEEIFRIMSVSGGEMGMSVRCIKKELPLSETVAATAVGSVTATLNGRINPNGVSTTVSFEYGVTASYGFIVGAMESPPSGASPVGVSANLTGLTKGNTYHYRVRAINSGGTSYGNDMSFTATLSIGESYEGGVVAYILQPGDPGYIIGETHGFIASISDLSPGIMWSNVTSSAVGGTVSTLGSGQANTTLIVNQAGYNNGIPSAVQLCYNYTNTEIGTGVYSDWYLPSLDELNKLYLNKTAIEGFTGGDYWSSTEYNDGSAWYFAGFPIGAAKFGTYVVRAVRSF